MTAATLTGAGFIWSGRVETVGVGTREGDADRQVLFCIDVLSGPMCFILV